MITRFAEQVTPGHPDKVADQIADTILDTILEQDPYACVAVEALITGEHITLGGETATDAHYNAEEIARRVIHDIGYTDQWWSNVASTHFHNFIQPQSPDLNANISEGAGDQGVMYGYACDTDDYLPLEYSLATKVAKIIYQLHKDNPEDFGPDGKTTATVDEHGNVLGITAAILHALPLDEARRVVAEEVRNSLNLDVPIDVNTSGPFTVGGPSGDTGVLGRKIIADSYGGRGRHGGGAFSGKDSRKVDRTGAYYARSLAIEALKELKASEVEVQIGYSIGDLYPRSLNVLVDGVETLWTPSDGLLTPWEVASKFELRSPIHAINASLGHFTRDTMPWNI